MRTEILSVQDLPKAVAALEQGEVVGMPTETVYGLAAVFSNPQACLKVFEVKSRLSFDPLIVHVFFPETKTSFLNQLSNLGLIDLAQIAERMRPQLELLLRTFWPGPLTVVLPRGKNVSDVVTSGLNTVAIRAPKHPVAQSLLKAVGLPLVAPSANRFGRISPTTANDVVTELGGLIPSVLDGGRCEIGLESTVVMPLPDGTLRYLRPGAISKKELELFWRAPVSAFYDAAESSQETQGLKAPGRLPSHYAPKTALHILPAALPALSGEQWLQLREKLRDEMIIGILCFQGDLETLQRLVQENLEKPAVIKVVSPTGNIKEAAQLFFGSLRVLDLSPAEIILAEPCPWNDEGLGWALQDRLKKAEWKESSS